jgi:hypothetical protein
LSHWHTIGYIHCNDGPKSKRTDALRKIDNQNDVEFFQIRFCFNQNLVITWIWVLASTFIICSKLVRPVCTTLTLTDIQTPTVLIQFSLFLYFNYKTKYGTSCPKVFLNTDGIFLVCIFKFCIFFLVFPFFFLFPILVFS